MFRTILHTMLSLLVLACPATGGLCCGDTGCESAIETTCAIASDSCCGCCHSEHGDDSLPRQAPDNCHDCFCSGALPPGPNAGAVLTDFSKEFLSASVDVVSVSNAGICLHVVDAAPVKPTGQAMLRTYCLFLL